MLVRDAGQLAARMRAGADADELDVRRKTSVTDLVSAADHAAEALIVDRLRAARPDDGLVGEEGAHRVHQAGGERTWFIDPVDGTYNFLSGLADWCSALALADGTGPVLGAVYRPASDELWLGGRGHPTTRGREPVERIADRPLEEISLACYLHPPRLADASVREPMLHAIAGAAALRMLGSGSVELAAVASGRLGAWLQVDAPDWDWLPGAALVHGVGGVTEVLEAHGHRWHLAGGPGAVAELGARVLGA
jgi:fructose-1,6-bisphosphatase/inositol monophosphatase family enzyme